MPREMADVLDRIVKEYGQKQGIKSRDELISKILSIALTGAAESGSVEYNGNHNVDSKSES
jgi:hypothetical protein